MKVVDMHCDTISAIREHRRTGQEICLRENLLHLDLQKMKQGDYLLQNFAMFVYLEEEKKPLKSVLELIDIYYQELEKNQDLIAPVFCYQDIQKNQKNNKLSALLTVEEGAVCEGSLTALRTLYRLGVRMMTLTWNFENELAYPNTVVKQPDYDSKKFYGLKETGIEFIKEMNRLGMIVDVSHLNDDGFWDVIKYSEKPFVASHSNSRSVCGHTRNMTDEMIRALAEKGGVMGLNFCGPFLNEDGSSRVEDMIHHLKHIRQVGGIGCLGLGTDYDGIDGVLELQNASYMPVLAEAMERNGFTTEEIEAVFYKNVLRVYQEIL